MRDIDELVYIDVMEDFYWSQFNTGVSIGKPGNSNSFGYQYQGDKYNKTVRDGGIYSLIDSGSNAIFFSELYFGDFIK